MRNVLTATALLIGTIASANVLAATAQPYNVKIFNLENEAVVKVTDQGQPVSNVAVHVTGTALDQTYTTSKSGTVFVKNYTDNAQSLKISVQEPNGQAFTTERFVSAEH
jgi:hypothetical protein